MRSLSAVLFLFATAAAALAQPAAQLSVTAIGFGNVQTGATREQRFKLFSTGTDSLLVQAPAVIGSSFAVTSPATFPLAISPGSSLDFTVRFSAAQSGVATGSVALTTSATGALSPVRLSGAGFSGVTSSPSLAAGDVRVNAGAAGIFLIALTNPSGMRVSALECDVLQEPGAISLTSIALGGAAFVAERTLNTNPINGGFHALVSGSTEGAIGDGAVLLARFVALGGTGPTGRIGLTNIRYGLTAAGPVTQSGNVFGTATLEATSALMLSVAPAVVDYGVARLGTSTPRTVAIHNSGTATLDVSNISVTQGVGIFIIAGGNFSTTLVPGAVSNPVIRYLPPSAGIHRGTLTVRVGSTTVNVPLVGIAAPAGASVPVPPGEPVTLSSAADLNTTQPGRQIALHYTHLGALEEQTLRLELVTASGTASASAPVRGGQADFVLTLPPGSDGDLFLKNAAGAQLQVNAAGSGGPATNNPPDSTKCSLSRAGGGNTTDLLPWAFLLGMLALNAARRAPAAGRDRAAR